MIMMMISRMIPPPMYIRASFLPLLLTCPGRSGANSCPGGQGEEAGG